MWLKPKLLWTFNRLLKQTEIDMKNENKINRLPFTLVNGLKLKTKVGFSLLVGRQAPVGNFYGTKVH